jgi:folate-dependent phosphoribosylglycinamide formyltransferase PurN
MRIVILCPSPFSESSIVMTVQLARLGYVPVGVLTLPSFDLSTLLRKTGQWGSREVVHYARAKLLSRGRSDSLLRNPYLRPLLANGAESFRSLRQVAKRFGFPVVVCKNQNSSSAIVQLNEWSPDLIVFTGGNILRKPLLDVARLGVINLHLGLLPEVRGMSSPEWSLLNGVPTGVTVHYIDAGVDTGSILGHFEFPNISECSSLDDLRHRLIAFGVEKLGEIVTALDRGTISAQPQSELNVDNQYFVMHEWLKNQATQRLKRPCPAVAETTSHG